MSRHVPRHTFQWSPPPPLRVMVAQPAQVTQVPITLTQHNIAAAPCDTTHPMWRHRGTARLEPPPPPPPPRRGWVSSLDEHIPSSRVVDGKRHAKNKLHDASFVFISAVGLLVLVWGSVLAVFRRIISVAYGSGGYPWHMPQDITQISVA